MTDRKEGRLAGKIALVTGGSSGIGRAIVERLAAEGTEFIGIQYSSHPDAAAEVVDMVNALGIQAVALRAEFSADGKGASQRLWSEFAHAVTERIQISDVSRL